MTKKFPLLLLDADVVIELHCLGIWDQVVERCDVHVARSIANDEALYFKDEQGGDCRIDLSSFEGERKITVFDVAIAELERIKGQFDPTYLERFHSGETESFVCLLNSAETCLICSGDKIVYKVLGNLNRGEQGISVEELLQGIGLGCTTRHQFTRQYRQHSTKKGGQERIQDRGYKAP